MKITIKAKDKQEQLAAVMYQENYHILWELKHNFWRRWKHADGSEEYLKGLDEVIEALKEELIEFIDE